MRNTFFITTLCAVVLAVPVLAAALVNINTADSATLQTLNGIGVSKAQAIIDYRTQHGTFTSIEQIMNVSGIGTATYNGIKDFITVSDQGSQAQAQTQSQSQATSSTQTIQTSNSNPPPAIRAYIDSAAHAFAGAGSAFTGEVYDNDDAPLITGVRYIWNFGDGTTAEGRYVLHTYQYPGTYSVELIAAYNYSTASVRTIVEVRAATVALVAEGDGSLTVRNNATTDIDIGMWSLTDGAHTFTIPQDTLMVAGGGVQFAAGGLLLAAGVPGVAGTRDSVLLYPNGTRAATATVGLHSPLRGVAIAPVHATLAPAPKATVATTSIENSNLASAASSGGSVPPWVIFGALAGVLGIGAVGAYYAQTRPRAETSPSKDEFEIEHD